ncbi:MAG TPA: GWxTD domain-containing protein [Terriglobales bacterium]|nr:GWxTD domain-containing protein [Terriglobales bacterium]
MSDGFVRRLFLIGLAGTLLGTNALGQSSSDKGSAAPPAAQSQSSTQAQPASQEQDPLKRPLSEKEKKEHAKALKQELSRTYKKWLDEDVRWIITDEEKDAFKKLSNDEERDQFIEQFWLRRDPTPDTVENEYKEEHYRRIAYANEHFASGIPGWRTDRGRLYIQYGPPDEIDAHPSGGQYERPIEEGGGSTSTYPFETWRWRYLEGVGQEIEVEFVDQCMCGEYRLSMDRSEKDALLHVPGAGETLYEQMGMASKTQRFTNPENLGPGPMDSQLQSKEFDRLEMFAKLNRAPAIKFKDLEEVVTTKIHYNLMPFEVRADFIKVTSDTVLVPITIEMKNKDITFQTKDGVSRGVVNIYGRVTTLTGKIAQTFEDTVERSEPSELLPKVLETSSLYWKALPLKPGRYRVDLVLKDVNGDRKGSWSKGIIVPEYGDEKLTASTLILADQMEKVPAKSVGAGSFVIGTTKVRPRLDSADGKPATFKRDQRINFWMQVYNLGIDQQTKKPSATIEYDVVNTATNKEVVHAVESTKDLGNVGEQVTLEKSLALSRMEPGIYRVTIKINDSISKQEISPSARFAVE